MNKKTIIQKHFQKIDQLSLAHETYKKCVDDLCEWLLRNDRVQHDMTTRLLFPKSSNEITARIIGKQQLTVAGVEEVGYLLQTFTEIQFDSKKSDGSLARENEVIMELHGSAAEILAYERTILNLLQRLSGIATATHDIVSKIAGLGYSHTPLIAATRKTQWTLLDKKAVALGGGGTHRLSLSDGVLVKDNHLLLLKERYKLQNEPELALKTFEILTQKATNVLIEIEIEKKESLEALVKAATFAKHNNTLCILLDNFTPSGAKSAIDEMHKTYDISEIIFEASGGINSNNIAEWALTGVDVISLGALTHSAQAANISMEVI